MELCVTVRDTLILKADFLELWTSQSFLRTYPYNLHVVKQ